MLGAAARITEWIGAQWEPGAPLRRVAKSLGSSHTGSVVVRVLLDLAKAYLPRMPWPNPAVGAVCGGAIFLALRMLQNPNVEAAVVLDGSAAQATLGATQGDQA